MENKQLLNLEGSDSDDVVKEFELPPARSRRPRIRRALAEAKATTGPGWCSFRCFIMFIVTSVLCGAVVLLGWLVLSMQTDIQHLKVQFKTVESSDKSSSQESAQLQDAFQKKIFVYDKDKEQIEALKRQVKFLTSQVKTLNLTVKQLELKTNTPGGLQKLTADVEQLQKGMADSGSEKSNLQDVTNQIKKNVALLARIVRKANGKIFNLSLSVARIEQAPLPTRPSLTPAPLVVTVSPDTEAPTKESQSSKISLLLKNVLNGYKDFLKNKTILMSLDLNKMSSGLENLNETHRNTVVTLTREISNLKNITNSQEEQLKKMESRLAGVGQQSSSNSSSLSQNMAQKLLITVKEIVEDLKRYHAKVNNLTELVNHIRSVPSDTQVRSVDKASSDMAKPTLPPNTENGSIFTTPTKQINPSTTVYPSTTAKTKLVSGTVNQTVSHSQLPTPPALAHSEIPYTRSGSSFTVLSTKSSVNLTGITVSNMPPIIIQDDPTQTAPETPTEAPTEETPEAETTTAELATVESPTTETPTSAEITSTEQTVPVDETQSTSEKTTLDERTDAPEPGNAMTAKAKRSDESFPSFQMAGAQGVGEPNADTVEEENEEDNAHTKLPNDSMNLDTDLSDSRGIYHGQEDEQAQDALDSLDEGI